MNNTNPPDIKKIYQGLQEEMRAKLLGVAAHLAHPTEKGDATEGNWLNMLQDYLPKRYQAERAMVVDYQGSFSQQIDIVIFDRQYSPFVLHHGQTRLVPVESVYAVFEVKPDLSNAHIFYAGQKAASVRALQRTNAPLVDKGQVKKPRDLFPILGGLLCSRSQWKKPFGTKFRNALSDLSEEQRLELGCCLEGGVFENTLHLAPLAFEPGELETQYPSFKQPDALKVMGDGQNSLVVFLYTLLHRLQMLGTAPAIDYTLYRDKLI